MNQSFKSILVTQSFGRESEYRRVVLAILSAFVFGDNGGISNVVLFTDKPDFFKKWLSGIDVHYVLLTPEKVKNMRGEIDFLHHMKIALIEESFQLFPDHNIFYIDSDTFFVQSPLKALEKVNEKSACMHLIEYPFIHLKDMPLPAGDTFQAFYRLINETGFSLKDGSIIKVTGNDSSWNAGVMCFHHSHYKFIPDVYLLTNQIYPKTKNHASEQYAFSIMLQKYTDLQDCEPVVYHYWYRIKKEIIDIILAEKTFLDLQNVDLEQKLNYLRKFINNLPIFIDQHYLMYLDNAVQTFNENKFVEGYSWYLKAFLKQPKVALKMFKDVLYHTKRMLFLY